VKIAYAFRRESWYPHFGPRGTELMPAELRSPWLRKVNSLGFDGLEISAALPDGGDVSESTVGELRRQLEGSGLPVLGVRGGGGLIHPRTVDAARSRWEQAIQFAAWVGSPTLNGNLCIGSHQDQPGHFVGDPLSQDGSREASEEDYERSASILRPLAERAADLGVGIALEVHQHSIIDTSWGATKFLALVDRANVSINPDLGNIYWLYDEPEETSESAIVALAPFSGAYWHCKNLTRIHIPENRHAIFLQVQLHQGDIDYRFALAAMLDAGFDGTFALEGVRVGDQYERDGASLAYIRQVAEELS
jgi:sugar phosphate isomerase/epimerase